MRICTKYKLFELMIWTKLKRPKYAWIITEHSQTSSGVDSGVDSIGPRNYTLGALAVPGDPKSLALGNLFV